MKTKDPQLISATSESEAEEGLKVKKILRRKVKDGKVYYLVSWIGFGPEDNSWQPADSLRCSRLIRQFERRRLIRNQRSASKTASQSAPSPPADDKSIWYEPERIVATTVQDGELLFVIKWKGAMEADLVSSSQLSSLFPQLVIDFYQQRLLFHQPSSAV